MIRNVTILLVLILIVALPFLFRQKAANQAWQEGDPVLVIITPHNEATRHEFGLAFSRWHLREHGVPVKVDWRNIGGATEIMRYVSSETIASFRAWWRAQGKAWRPDAATILLNRRFDPSAQPDGVTPTDWQEQRELFLTFRESDDAQKFSSQIDLLFGGGAYDCENATRQGLLVPPWPAGKMPPGLVATHDGVGLIPEFISGETWRTPTYFGTAASTFGICYNRDRLQEKGIPHTPAQWSDLGDPRWFGTLGLADPTKSGSMAKAFETIVHVECRRAVEAAGFGDKVSDYEAQIAAAKLPPGQMPPGVPVEYQNAIEAGWAEGIRLIQKLSANARYFTDSASQVVIDVGMGNTAAGLCIDFYGRYEAQMSNGSRSSGAMTYTAVRGGSGVSADPIALLRGAPHRELACRFIEFVLSEEGQKLWCYRVGTPGGPQKYSLQRLPIRRDFYPSERPDFQATHERHRAHTAENLGEPQMDIYQMASEFTYCPRWTAGHFGLFRDWIRAMSMDAGPELRTAWAAIIAAGGPTACPQAMNVFERFPEWPEPLTWAAGLSMGQQTDRLDLLREWTIQYRAQYNRAAQLLSTTSSLAKTKAQ